MRRVTEAVLLSSRPVGEGDLLVVALSRASGLLRAVAKGARKSRRRFVNALEPFSHLRLHLRAGRPGLLPFLDQADLLEPFEPLRLDPRRYVLASYFAELTESFFRPLTGREFFPVLLSALEHLARDPGPWGLLKAAFEARLLGVSGFAPALDRCVRCQRPVTPPLFFSPADGGVVCQGCRFEGDQGLSGPAWALLRHLRSASPPSLRRIRVPEEVLAEAAGLLEGFLRRTLDREVNALRVLKEML